MATDETASSSSSSAPTQEASVAWQSSRVARTSPSPFPRVMYSTASLPYGSASGKQSQRLFLFGGVNAHTGEHCGDLWSLDLDQEPPLKWKQNLEAASSGASQSTSGASSLSASIGASSPPLRCNFAMVALPSEGLVLVHGGEAEGEAPPLNDLWILAGVTGSSPSSSTAAASNSGPGSESSPRWLEATGDPAAAETPSKVLVRGTAPTPRCSHGATWVADARVVVFFGGVGTPAAAAEGAIVSAVDGAGSGPEGSGKLAENGNKGSAAMDADVVGAAESPLSKLSLADSPENDDDDDDDYEDEDEGESALVPLNDVWILHLDDSEGALRRWRWSSLAPAFGLAPSPRSLPALACSPGEGNSSSSVFVFGGYGLYEVASDDTGGASEGGEIRMGYLRDLWALDVSTGQWTCSDDLSPPGTDFAAAAAAASSSSSVPQLPAGSEVQARNGHGLVVLGRGSAGNGGGGGTAVTFGGYTGAAFLNSVEVFRADWANVGVRAPKDDDEEDDEVEEDEEDDEDEDEEADGENEEMAEEEVEDEAGMEEDESAEGAAPKHEVRSDNALSVDEVSTRADALTECGENGEERGNDNDDDDENAISLRHTLRVPVRMWEFGQNDPKRDSGSKLVRLGLAQTLKIKDYFGGVVLNAEASTVVSPADADMLLSKGVGGVNCSWNRLKEVPSRKLGKATNHRLLPYLLAANSVRLICNCTSTLA